MKKAAILVVCLCFAFANMASFFAMESFNQKAAAVCAVHSVSEHVESNQSSEPGNSGAPTQILPNVNLRYQDVIAEDASKTTLLYNHDAGSKNYIKHHGEFGAFYNTFGYLTLDIVEDSPAESKLENMRIEVTRLGEPGIDEDLDIEWGDTDDNEGRTVFYWNYRTIAGVRAVGVYRISIFVLWLGGDDIPVWHQPIPGTCFIPHEHNQDCDEDCGIVVFRCSTCQFWNDHDHVGCEICLPTAEELEFTFYSVCRSPEPDFGATFTAGGDPLTETASIATKTKFEVRARPRNSSFYWNADDAIYTTDSGLLKVGAGGKYLILNASSAGKQTLKFSVTFSFWHVDATGQVTLEQERTENVILRMNFFARQWRASVWDVILGIGILAALGVAAWFVTKLSKNVDHSM